MQVAAAPEGAADAPDHTDAPTSPESGSSGGSPEGTQKPETSGTSSAEGPKKLSREELLAAYRQAAEELTPEELLDHNRLGGIVGSAAQKLARKQELRRLRESDPAAFAREMAREEEGDDTADETWGEFDALVLTPFFTKHLSENVLKELKGKTFQGDRGSARLAALTDAFTTAVKLEVEAAKETWEKELRPTLYKEVLTELRGGDVSPDASSANAKGGGLIRRFTPDQIERMNPIEVAGLHLTDEELTHINNQRRKRR